MIGVRDQAEAMRAIDHQQMAKGDRVCFVPNVVKKTHREVIFVCNVVSH